MEKATSQHKLVDAKTVSKMYFGGMRKPTNILIDASKGFLPSVRLGKRVFFDTFALDELFEMAHEKAKERMAAVQTAQAEAKEKNKETDNTSVFVCPGITPIKG